MKIVNRHTHTHRKDENYIPPWHTSYARGIDILIYFVEKMREASCKSFSLFSIKKKYSCISVINV